MHGAAQVGDREAAPLWVVRQADHVEVGESGGGRLLEPVESVLRLGNVDDDVDRLTGRRGHGPHRRCPGFEQGEIVAPIKPDGVFDEPAVGLVADLHHVGQDARGIELLEGLGGIRAEGVGEFIDVGDLRPGRWRVLPARIGPLVGVVEVEQRLHSRGLSALGTFG